MTGRKPSPARAAGGADPDPAPRAQPDEADKREDYAVTDEEQVRRTAAGVRRSQRAAPAGEGAQDHRAGQAAERARAGAGKEAARAAERARRHTASAGSDTGPQPETRAPRGKKTPTTRK